MKKKVIRIEDFEKDLEEIIGKKDAKETIAWFNEMKPKIDLERAKEIENGAYYIAQQFSFYKATQEVFVILRKMMNDAKKREAFLENEKIEEEDLLDENAKVFLPIIKSVLEHLTTVVLSHDAFVEAKKEELSKAKEKLAEDKKKHKEKSSLIKELEEILGVA